MRGLTALAWRSLAARRVRTLLSVLGVGLGVAVLYAAVATSAGIDASIDRVVRDVVGRADLRVAAFQERGLSDESVNAIRTAPGVAAAVPALERRTYLAGPLGSAMTLPPPVTVLGIDPVLDPEVRDLELVEGSPLLRRDEAGALVTERLADADGYGLGSEITLQGAGAPERFRVVGILAADGPLVGAVGRVVVVPIAAASRVFGAEGVSRVDVRLADGADPAAVEDELVGRLTIEPYVLSSPQDLAASLRASTAEVQSTTALVAAVVLFGAAFLIFNTLSMTVSERSREVGLLRAAGATRGQVMRFVLTGGLVLGVMGSIVGVALGVLFASFMAGYVRAIVAVPLDPIEPPIGGLLLAVVLGLLVTLAAALEPARRAGRISPVEALKSRAEGSAVQRARLRWLALVFIVVGLVGSFAWPQAAGPTGGVRALVVFAILLAVALVTPFLLRPLGRLAGLPFRARLGLEERLARAAMAADRSRTALTVGALAIGLAMLVALGGVAENARREATDWLVDVVPGDEVVTAIRPVAAEEGIADALAEVDGVERVTAIAAFDVAYDGRRLDAAAASGADLLADGRLTFVAGDREAALADLDGGGTVILPRSVAEPLDLAVGDTIELAAANLQALQLRVSGIVDRSFPGRGGEAMLVAWSDAAATLGVAGADVFAVRFEPDATVAQRAALEAAARQFALEPSPLERVEGAVAAALGRVFGLFDALAIVAVLVAGLGIVNTLTMSVIERVREIGVLRATGMTRGQVASMVVVEAGMLGLVGAIVGIAAGVVVGAVMVVLGGGRPDVALDPPWLTIGLALVLGVAVAMVAAYWPARVASRLGIVRAVRFE
jgi:putative ABC transport system permease protein